MKKDKKPVILIPGIQGTKLSNTNEVDFKTIWSGIKKYFTNIHSLTLQFDGESDKGAENIIERADVENIAYSEIVNYLRSLGYRVFIFGYDWRKSNKENGEILGLFVNKIQRKLNESKVNFITHSMGGLVLSAYLKSISKTKQDKIINKIIFTVPPFLGSVESTYNLVIGKSRLFNSSDDFRKVGRTFPGLYELLPVYKDAYKFETKQDFDFYNFDTFWQQIENSNSESKVYKHRLIKHRLEELGAIRKNENDFIFDLNKLEDSIKKRCVILAGGGEKTKTQIIVKTTQPGYKYFFDFQGDKEEDENGGDGTVPLQSSTVFKDAINTLIIKTTWLEKRADSRFIMADWHAFFLNNGRVQNIVKRFFDPGFIENENWYTSAGGKINKM